MLISFKTHMPIRLHVDLQIAQLFRHVVERVFYFPVVHDLFMILLYSLVLSILTIQHFVS